MKIILLNTIKNLGVMGNLVDVKAGYARNFLIPTGKAVLGTKKNINLFQERSKELKEKLDQELHTAQKRAKEIHTLGNIRIKVKAGSGGKLFGSISSRDIASAISSKGIAVDKKEVHLPNKFLRTIGHHEVYIQLHQEVSEKLVVIIDSET